VRHPYGTTLPESAKLTPNQSELMLDSPLRDTGHSSGSSPGLHSQSSSPQMSPRPLGSVDDLDHFRDLFYRPTVRRTDGAGSSGAAPSTLSWDMSSHRNGSGLTSLARQLSVELEELNARFDPTDGTPLEQTPDGLQFILSEARDSGSLGDMLTLDRERLLAFRPSFNFPEDVDSFRSSSSVLRRSPGEDDTETGAF
jgi:serine/arginine repetitive matrix protein 2